MDRFLALYRGINVGGKNTVKMDALRALHEAMGHRDVASYIQSGNVVFAAKGTAASSKDLAGAFAKKFGFSPQIVVVPAARWGEIVHGNPYAKFSAKEPKTVHTVLCDGEPSADGLKALLKKTGGRETFVVKEGLVYLHAPDGFGTSKFATGMERAAGVPITVRNWSTTEALWKMLEGDQATD